MGSPILKGKRPNAPLSFPRNKPTTNQAREWGLIPPTTMIMEYDTTFHHNIPWETLRDSWNPIYAFCDADLVDEIFYLYYDTNRTTHQPEVLLYKLLQAKDALGLTESNCNTKTYKEWMAALDSGQGALGETHQLNSEDGDALYSIVAWQKWNLVEGPKEAHRADDPGSDGFDDFRWCDTSHFVRYELVHTFYEVLADIALKYSLMQNSRCDLRGTVAAWNQDLKVALQTAKGLKGTGIIGFDQTIWKALEIGGQSRLLGDPPLQYHIMVKRQFSGGLMLAQTDNTQRPRR